MDATWYLDNEDFSGLASCDFEEVRWVFNYYRYFVEPDRGSDFIEEAKSVKDDYTSRLSKIDEYQIGEYEAKIRRGDDVLYSDEPTYMVMMLETEVKGKLIELMRKYFSKAFYEKSKADIPQYAEPSDESTEDVPALQKALAQIRNQLYAFLSHIDYYMRHYGYFIRRRNVWLFVRHYSESIAYVNKGIDFGQYFYFLGSWGRPGNKYKDFIDVDPISMEQLILGMCQYNTKQLAELANIFGHAIRTYRGKDAYKKRCDEMADYIKKCEEKGLMKKVS